VPLLAELGSLTRTGFARYDDPQFMNNLAAAVSAARK
jgi:hypothetical protein